MVSILYPGMPQGPDLSGFTDGLAGLGQMLDNRRANKAWDSYDQWLRGVSGSQQAQQQPMSLASLGQQGGQVERAPLPPVQDVASQRVAQAHAASGGTPQQGAIEAYIRHAAKQRGIDPEIAVRVAMSEGGVSDPTRQSDVVKNGVREQSYGPFQLYMGGGLGNEFQQATGLHPSDPGAWQKGIDFALDKAKEGGWGPWYGAAKAGIGDRDGIGGAPAALNAMSGQSGQQMPQGAPLANSGSLLPPADVMKTLFKSEQTRPLAIQLAQSAQKARMGDPMAQLELEKARLEVEKLRNPSPEEPKIVELFDEGTGQPYKATYNGQTGQYERVGGIKAPSGMQVEMGPDGQFTLTQGPLKDKPLNEGEAKNAGFLVRGRDANAVISELEDQGTSMWNKTMRAVPGGLGNFGLGPEAQRFEQAKRDFVNAVLRRESGAVIAQEEFDNADQQYFPQPGDGPEVIQQKRRNRENAIKGFELGAGSAGKQGKTRYRFNLDTGELE